MRIRLRRYLCPRAQETELNLPRMARTSFNGLQRILKISAFEAQAEAEVRWPCACQLGCGRSRWPRPCARACRR